LTGDRALLAQAYPAMKRVADYINAAVDQTGLVYQLPGGSGPYQYGIIDWPSDMRYDTVVNGNGAELVVNALAVGADNSVASAAEALGQAQDAITYGGHGSSIAGAVNTNLYNAQNGLYSDGLAAGTLDRIENYSQHAQTYAVDFGIAPTSRYDRLGDAIAAAGMHQGPMDLRQLELALGRTGRTAALVSLLTDPGHPGPAQILAEGGTFMWENWNPGCAVAGCTGAAVNQNDNTSFSHGWGSAGIDGILESLLGLTVTGAGGSSVVVQPPTSGLSQASGTEWTERGPVQVSWRRAGRAMLADVTVPVNVTATVVLGGKRVIVGSGRHQVVNLAALVH
jgi:Bacterial alpha-L-rhamnosidase 6 hairpin glycosidase domain/Bacterial alpha-L-rhamnosidase C-terminal domain